MNIQEAKNISIIDYLAKLGFTPERITSKEYWYKIRVEKTASCCVNRLKNVWFDYGIGKGGNLIDIVMFIHSITNVADALKKISETTGYFSFCQQPTSTESIQENKIEILKVTSLQNKALLCYANSRGIADEVIKAYCKELYYQIGDKKYFSIGFENRSGGFEMRNAFIKNAISPKDITFIDNGFSTVACFEGLFDWLSFIQLQKNMQELNFLILNSTANIKKALPIISNHKSAFLFLDNDDTGRKASEEIKSLEVGIVDYSFVYKNYNDLNDLLKAKYGLPKNYSISKSESLIID